MDGEPVTFSSPREALDAGIATVFQDLAMIPLMAIWRNFFLGSEPTKGWGPLQRFDKEKAKRITKKELGDMGIDIRDPDQPVGTLSGGERQSVAIARAVHFGARLLILDEPTSALGVRQAGVVLKYILAARDRGLGRHLHHAQPAPRLPGGRPVPAAEARAGRWVTSPRARSRRDELTQMMAGGAELEQLSHELSRGGEDAPAELAEVASEIQAEAKGLGIPET